MNDQSAPVIDTAQLEPSQYPNFVRGLFVKPFNDMPGQLMHAAIGVLGEVMELQDAVDQANAHEELGDLHFYIQAMYNHFQAPRPLRFSMTRTASYDYSFELLRQAATDLHDKAKKHWIYSKPIVFNDLYESLSILEKALGDLTLWWGSTPENLILGNMRKLVVRYPGGTYTDAAAQARADKPAGQ